jgi:3',5'-cyclic AMP phosphodiesterase CpdA
VLLWVLSDFHIGAERGWDLPPPGKRPPFDVMVVAGDVITRQERGVRWLAERVSDRPVLYVSGNHEPYGEDILRDVDKARRAAIGTSVTVLNNETAVIGDVTFVGACFWTDFALFGNPERAMACAGEVMNDYRKIRKGNYVYRLRPEDTLALNRASRAYFAAAARNATTDKIVAISHHCPHPLGLRAGTEEDLISAAYANSGCDDLIQMFDAWVYGHTHETKHVKVGRSILATNAKGYGFVDGNVDNPAFDIGFTIEI